MRCGAGAVEVAVTHGRRFVAAVEVSAARGPRPRDRQTVDVLSDVLTATDLCRRCQQQRIVRLLGLRMRRAGRAGTHVVTALPSARLARTADAGRPRHVRTLPTPVPSRWMAPGSVQTREAAAPRPRADMRRPRSVAAPEPPVGPGPSGKVDRRLSLVAADAPSWTYGAVSVSAAPVPSRQAGAPVPSGKVPSGKVPSAWPEGAAEP